MESREELGSVEGVEYGGVVRGGEGRASFRVGGLCGGCTGVKRAWRAAERYTRAMLLV